MIGVLDTSAVLRLFIPDGPLGSQLSRFLQNAESGRQIAIAPELLWVEATNVVLKQTRRNELSPREGESLLGLLNQLPVQFIPHDALICRAYAISTETNLSAGDAT